MGEVTQSIDVEAKLDTVYNQWTQFEDFPRFMEGVTRIDQVDDRRLRWTVNVAGVDREFDAEITEQSPDQRIAWKSTSGPDQAGVVTFHRLSDRETRVTLQMKFDPDGFVENVGDKLGFVSARTKGDLERFKAFIEDRGAATGAWRGEIDHEDAGVGGNEADGDEGLVEGDLVGGDTVGRARPAEVPAPEAHTEPDPGEVRDWAIKEEVEEVENPDASAPKDYEEGMRRYGG